MKVKLNKFEQTLMKISNFWSKDIRNAGKTGEIENDIRGSILLQVIGLPILITMMPLKSLLHGNFNIFGWIGTAGGICVLLGILIQLLMFIDECKISKKNKAESKNINSLEKSIDNTCLKNELLFTKENQEKEMNKEN